MSYKKRKGDTDTLGKRLYNEGGKDWSDATVNQRMPRVSSIHQKLGSVREGFFSPELSESACPGDTLISDS